MTIQDAVKQSRKRREETRQAFIDEITATEVDGFTTGDFRVIWNNVSPEHQGVFGTVLDMTHAKGKLDALLKMIDSENPGDYLTEFLRWTVTEWVTLKTRPGTQWMHERDMLPRHPTMRFVLHHWTHFHAAYADRVENTAYNYVDPRVEDMREDVAYLELKLQEAAKFGKEALLERVIEENKTLKKRIARLEALCAPHVDLSTDLPTWDKLNEQTRSEDPSAT